MCPFQVGGMGCSRCANKITQSLQAHDPAAVVQADLTQAGSASQPTRRPMSCARSWRSAAVASGS